MAAILSEAVPVIAIDGFRGAQWTKLIVNMLNAVPAIVGRSVQDVVDDRHLRRVVAASMRETVRVGIARGVRFGSLQGLGDRRLRLFARMPLAVGQLLPRLCGCAWAPCRTSARRSRACAGDSRPRSTS